MPTTSASSKSAPCPANHAEFQPCRHMGYDLDRAFLVSTSLWQLMKAGFSLIGFEFNRATAGRN